jgi:hypothetical protein
MTDVRIRKYAMRRQDMSAKRSCAMRGSRSFAADAVPPAAMPRNPRAIVRTLNVGG